MVNQSAVVTITFEYVPGRPTGFKKVTPIWLDIGPAGGCDGSDMPAFNGTFEYSSSPWTANATGRITEVIGHLHDGGTNIKILNDNTTLLCDPVATYGGAPGFIDAPGSMSMSSMTGNMAYMGMHISSLTSCSTGQVNLGDKLSVDAYYNGSEYQMMTNTDGSLAPIMGIALVYLAQNETYSSTSTSPTATGLSTATSTAGAATVTSGPFLMAAAMGGMVALGFA